MSQVYCCIDSQGVESAGVTYFKEVLHTSYIHTYVLSTSCDIFSIFYVLCNRVTIHGKNDRVYITEVRIVCNQVLVVYELL